MICPKCKATNAQDCKCDTPDNVDKTSLPLRHMLNKVVKMYSGTDIPSRPREWWLDNESDIAFSEDPGLSEFIHIIEFSAYEAVKAENERLKEILSYLPKVPTKPYEKELAQRILRLEAALEYAKKRMEAFRGRWSMHNELEEIDRLLAGEK